jgi:hypothetical protein
MSTSRGARSARRRRREARKDRLIQTRVAEDLEQALKEEAARRRLTVSHLIRNTLEDAFDLVEDVTADVEQLVSGSVELAAAVGRDARRIASIVRGDEGAPPASPIDPDIQSVPSPETPAVEVDPLEHVYGWNRIIANRAASCARCSASIDRGDDALVGLSDAPGPRVWLCQECGDQL